MSLKTATALLSTGSAVACTVWAGTYLMRYNSWQPSHEQYLGDGIRMLGAALAFASVPVIMVIAWGIGQFRRAAAASGLSPLQLAIVKWIGMEAVHVAWHEHNEHEADELTASVMGPKERKDPWS